MNDCQISRLTSIPLGTVRNWRVNERKGYHAYSRYPCPICDRAAFEKEAYAYLFGLYLGDGCLARMPKGVFRLEIALDLKYPMIVAECAQAIPAVQQGAKVTITPRTGFANVCSYWKHWPCLFPQHGPGPKHRRKIELAVWQRPIVERYPDRLIRGLIHSDGSRDLNHVNGKSYPRYQFSNYSADIQDIFCDACDRLGLHWTQPYFKTISISRRVDVAKMDEIVGPKR